METAFVPNGEFKIELPQLEVPKPPVITIDQPKTSAKGSDWIRVARVDPFTRRSAIVRIKAKMSEIRRLVGAKHVGQQHVATVDNTGIQIWVCCNCQAEIGPIWRIRDGLPVRGKGVLFGNAGSGAADFPADEAWLREFIVFPAPGELTVDGFDKAINDIPEPKPDA
jgi:hypothetical protein